MKLTNREVAWQKRKHVKKKEYHPTYARFGQYAGTLQERMKEIKTVDPYSEEGQKRQEESAKKYGRAWWIFTGKEMRYNREKTWIEQFHVEDPSRPRGEGIRSKVV